MACAEHEEPTVRSPRSSVPPPTRASLTRDSHSCVLDSGRRRDGWDFSSTVFLESVRPEVDWSTSCPWDWHSLRPTAPEHKRSAFQNRRDIVRKVCALLFHKRARDQAIRLDHDKIVRPRLRWEYPACCSRHSTP